MKLYVVRHGQTNLNAENKVCGCTDIDLNDVGIKQASETANKLTGRGIETIFASPLCRAMHTAEIIADTLGIKRIIQDSRLREQDYGIYEGTDRHGVQFLENKRHFAVKMPGGESIMQVAARAYGFLDDLHNINADGNILIVSHGSTCRAIRSYFTDMSNDEYFNLMLHNCEIMEFDI